MDRTAGSSAVWRRSTLAVALACAVAPALRAQRVRGIVRDSATGEPIPGAIVTLLDTAGRWSSRTLTSATGQFTLSIAGTVRRLTLVHIGFRPRSLNLELAPTHGDTTVSLAMVPLPTMLAAVESVDQPGCPSRDDRAGAFSLWDQVRSALLATLVARETNVGAVTMIEYNRRFDRDGRRLLSQRVHHASTTTNRPFVSARPATQFTRAGYVEKTGSDVIYFAPDADNLLDPAFAESHCFSLSRDAKSHAGQLGLAFEPSALHDSTAEIAGTLWIDSTARELRTLEFRFMNVGRATELVNSGGVLSFRNDAGVSIIDWWKLHVPDIAYGDRRLPGDAFGGSPRVIAMHDIGAMLTSALWPDSTRWSAHVGTVRGRLVRDDGKAPIANGMVWLAGTDDTARTALDGSFVLEDVFPGPYQLLAADSDAARASFAQGSPIDLRVDSLAPTPVTVRLPELGEFVRETCNHVGVRRASTDGLALVIAHVRLPDGADASNAAFDARWIINETKEEMHQRGIADSTGSFYLCYVPSGQRIPLSAALKTDGLAADDTLVFERRRVVHADVVLRRVVVSPRP